MIPQNPMLIKEEDDEVLLANKLRLLLVGRTGSGKSATGNIIFNDTVFVSEMSSTSVTRACQTHTDVVNNRSVTVIDTPDFIYSTHTDFNSDSELMRAFELCSPGPHVILLILPLSTFTEQEIDFISWFERIFGADALRFTLVLFTNIDKTHRKPLGDLISRNHELSGFIHQCGGGFCEININHPASRLQVNKLMQMIDNLVSVNRNSFYRLEMVLENKRRRKEEKRRAEEKKRTEEEESEREHKRTLERVRRETEIRVKREFEKVELERVKTMENQEKAENREKHSLLKQTNLKPVYVIIVFAVVTGGIFVWKEDNSPYGWTFMRGFFTGGSTSTAGFLTGFLCRKLWMCEFMMIRPSSHESPRAVNPLVSKTLSVLFGAAIGHYVAKDVSPVLVLAGAVGAYTAVQ